MSSKRYGFNWNELVEEQKCSGLSKQKFCEERDIPYDSFLYHSNKEKKTTSSEEDVKLVPIKETEPQNQISFVLNGNHVILPHDACEKTISIIVKAMCLYD